jgi:serine/threonine-protein kinase
MAASGDLFYLRATNRTRISVVDGRGQVTRRIGEDGNFFMPRISPDGRRLAVSRRSDGNPARWDLWVFDVASGVGQPITNDGVSIAPEWSSDGRIVYRKRSDAPGAGPEVWSIDPDRRTPPERLLASPSRGVVIMRTVLSPDARYALASVLVTEPTTTIALYLADLRGDKQLKPFGPAGSRAWGAAFSPDGHWVAFGSRESGQDELYVQPFPQEGARVRITSNGGAEPRWDADSRGIVYRDTRSGRLTRARLEMGASVTVTRREDLFAYVPMFPPINTSGTEPSYGVLGTNAFVIVERADPVEVIVVQGFANELKALQATSNK